MILKDRPRRLRSSPALREIAAETKMSVSQLMLPLFVIDGKAIETPSRNLPTCMTLSVDRVTPYLQKAADVGLQSVLLFGVSSKKDSRGSEALNPEGAVVRAIREIRERFPQITIATDIALDPYTDHGHDGLFEGGEILNDATVEVLTEMSILHAKSGAHIAAPSDMMDGRIAGIRAGLDSAHLEKTLLLAYTAKYASSLYGPFRETLGAQVVGDKKTYQMDPRNRREALRELELDLAEGADMVMVKPASWYLDIIADFKQRSTVPVVAYQVSGECSMIEVGVQAGLFERDRAILESIHSILRAGADLIVTYFAMDLARMLTNRN